MANIAEVVQSSFFMIQVSARNDLVEWAYFDKGNTDMPIPLLLVPIYFRSLKRKVLNLAIQNLLPREALGVTARIPVLATPITLFYAFYLNCGQTMLWCMIRRWLSSGKLYPPY